MKSPRSWSALAVFGFLLLGGCASVSLSEQKTYTTRQPTKIPKKIFIYPFKYDPKGKVAVDRSGKALDEFKSDLSKNLSKQLIKRLNDTIAPAEEITPGAILPTGNYWLITGRFTRVAQGSRLLRILIGLGSGGTKLNCATVIYSLDTDPPKPFLRIKSTGGSNISPGAIMAGPNPWGAGLNAIGGLPTGLSYDTTRTAREINSSLSYYLAKHGAIPPDQALYPKELGKFPNLSFQQFIRKKPVQKTGNVQVIPAAAPTPTPKLNKKKQP